MNGVLNATMTAATDLPLCAALLSFGPILLLAMALIPRGWANRNLVGTTRLAAVAVGTAFVSAIIAAFVLAVSGPVQHVFVQFGPLQFGVFFDVLSALILLLVSFLGTIVLRYSLHYLEGDPEQGRFLKWLCVTIGAVLMLIVSGNLGMFTLAWMATSLSLHKLLTFYGHRPTALLAARKKFIISRLGDLCLLAVLVLTYQVFGTWEFTTLFAQAQAMQQLGPGAAPSGVTTICLLLVAGAMLKSAQFPFHSWLPDTMETPTPVSALMHAGIINAGGFLVVRLSPVITLSPLALDTLAVVGGFTAIFASLVMMTQASVKRMLAFSTVAQMGFMMLQCGLGAFSIAVLHIIAHSLYKAHAFLSSGSVVTISQSSWTPAGRVSAHPGVLVASLFLASAMAVATGLAFGVSAGKEPGVLVLGAVFSMALTHLLWSLWGQSITPKLVGAGLLLSAAVSVAYYSLHVVFKWVLSPSLPQTLPGATTLDSVIAASFIALFATVLIFQEQLPQWSARPWCRALYVHSRNGFYINTLANRAVQKLWPAR